MNSAVPSSGLLVLGMHRSGTSALARVLDLCGADVGARLLGESAGNEAGRWEDAVAVELHERLLGSFGTRWQEALGLPVGWDSSEVATNARATLRNYLENDRSRHALWAVTDPRLSLLARLWLDAAADVSQPIGAVLMLRHPLEVASSLAARDEVAPGSGLLLWLEHTLAAAQVMDGVQRALITYDQLLQDWRGCIDRIRVLPGGEHLKVTKANARAVERFLDVSCRRHQDEIDAAAMPQVVSEVWSKLSGYAREGRLPAGAADRLAKKIAPVRELLHPVLDELRDSQRVIEASGERQAELGSAHQELEASRNREKLAGERLNDYVSNEASQRAERAEALASWSVQVWDSATGQRTAMESLVEAVCLMEGRLVGAITDDITLMQSVTVDALQAAAVREREAELARQIEPRLQAMEAGLMPLALRLPVELGALAEGIALNQSALVEAISNDIGRMQHEYARVIEASGERQAELASALQELEASRNREKLADKRLNDYISNEASQRAERAEALASWSVQVWDSATGQRTAMESLVEAVCLMEGRLVGAITDDITLMQSVATEAMQSAAVREREAELVRQIEPRLQALTEGISDARSRLGEAEGELNVLRPLAFRLEDAIAQRTRLELALTDREARLTDREARLADTLDRLRQITAEFEWVKSSNSWRWTHPFRVVNRFLSGQWRHPYMGGSTGVLPGAVAAMPAVTDVSSTPDRQGHLEND